MDEKEMHKDGYGCPQKVQKRGRMGNGFSGVFKLQDSLSCFGFSGKKHHTTPLPLSLASSSAPLICSSSLPSLQHIQVQPCKSPPPLLLPLLGFLLAMPLGFTRVLCLFRLGKERGGFGVHKKAAAFLVGLILFFLVFGFLCLWWVVLPLSDFLQFDSSLLFSCLLQIYGYVTLLLSFFSLLWSFGALLRWKLPPFSKILKFWWRFGCCPAHGRLDFD